MVKLDHIALIVSSERCLGFYKDLRFMEKKRIERNYDTVVVMECDDIVLEIFGDSNYSNRKNSPEEYELRYFSLGVDSLKDVKVKSGEIKADWFGNKYTFTNDPEGQLIELKERGKGR